MTDATRRFFDELAARGHEPLLRSLWGTIRFDLDTGDGVGHWFLRVRDGDVETSRRRGKADCVAGADGRLFDRIVAGEVNGERVESRKAPRLGRELGPQPHGTRKPRRTT